MHEQHKRMTRDEVQRRVREGIKAVLEEIMEEEMTQQLQAQHRERTSTRRGERNGHYRRGLTTEAGHIEQLRVPRAREMPFLTEVFERYRRPNDRSADLTGSMEEAILEMYLQGVSTRKVEAITGKLSGVKISKDAVSRIAARLEETLSEWRTRRLDGAYPYLYLDATYLKAQWAGAVCNVALLVAVGVSGEGYREVLAVEVAPGERTEGYRSLLKSLIERGLRGVRLVISDDHDAIKQAVKVELPQAAWQRCVVHFERNVLSYVPQSEMKAVASDLKVVFQAARRETAEHLAASFSARYQEVYPKAVAVLSRGLEEALTYTAFPSSHQKYIRTTNGLERLFREVKRRTRVVGVFPNERSAENLATVVMLRVSEDWALRRYLNMDPLHALFP